MSNSTFAIIDQFLLTSLSEGASFFPLGRQKWRESSLAHFPCLRGVLRATPFKVSIKQEKAGSERPARSRGNRGLLPRLKEAPAAGEV